MSHFNAPGVNIETLIENRVYIFRGYEEGDSYPSLNFPQVMIIFISNGQIELKAAKFDVPLRIGQARAVRSFLKKLGLGKYTYEKRDGVTLKKATTML